MIPKFDKGQFFGSCGGSEPAYRIERVLAQGGVGRVYVATVLATQEQVVIKVPRDWDFFYDITQEYRYLAGHRHPHVARCRGIDWTAIASDPEIIYLVTDLYQGTLNDVVRERRPITPAKAARWIRQVAMGLQATGLVHRDLKPANIFLDQQEVAFVADFGLAIPANPIVRREAGIGVNGLMGTYIYMPPEQMLEYPNIDVRADIYALGLILYELVVGQTARPRKRTDCDEANYLLDLLEWKIPYQKVLDHRVRAIVEAATNNDPSLRYQDHWDLLNDLEAIAAS